MFVFALQAGHGCSPKAASRVRAAPGIEPGTSRTLSENHATRPSSRLMKHASMRFAELRSRIRGLRQGGAERLQMARSMNASAGNRTRVTSMATMYSATRPLMLLTLSSPKMLGALGVGARYVDVRQQSQELVKRVRCPKLMEAKGGLRCLLRAR